MQPRRSAVELRLESRDYALGAVCRIVVLRRIPEASTPPASDLVAAKLEDPCPRAATADGERPPTVVSEPAKRQRKRLPRPAALDLDTGPPVLDRAFRHEPRDRRGGKTVLMHHEFRSIRGDLPQIGIYRKEPTPHLCVHAGSLGSQWTGLAAEMQRRPSERRAPCVSRLTVGAGAIMYQRLGSCTQRDRLALKSQLFIGDPALEAAAASDGAHVAWGANGPHVGKIQTALNLVNDAGLDVDGAYGTLTSAAVLNYKRARRIINTARQTQADDIVGRMTIAELDAEVVLAERPKGPIRIEPVFPPTGQVPSRLQGRSLIAFGFGDFPIPGSPSISSSQFELPLGGSTRFRVRGGANCTVDTQDHAVALVFDPNIPSAHGGKFSVAGESQEFELRARMKQGKTLVVVERKGKRSFPFSFDSAFAGVLVTRALPKREVTIAFNFVDGPNRARTTRSDDRSLDAVMNTLEQVYRTQTNVAFRRVPGSRLIVPDLEPRDPAFGVVFAKGRRTDDWKKITGRRATGALINVFFVRLMSIEDALFRDAAVGLSDRFGAPGFVARDSFLQDDLKGNPFELTVAHECGHCLGAEDNTIEGDLMRTPSPGKTISDRDAGIMNSSLASAR